MDGDRAILNAKLGGSCALYAIAMIFIGLRIFSRLYLFGHLAVDDWLMVVAAIAYTGSMVLEILAWIEFKDLNVVQYIKVRSHFLFIEHSLHYRSLLQLLPPCGSSSSQCGVS